MALNIKNERTHELVRRLAAMTGQSQTDAVEDAVRRRIDELSRHDDAVGVRTERLLEIAAAFQADLDPPDRAAVLTADDELYDDAGLPR